MSHNGHLEAAGFSRAAREVRRLLASEDVGFIAAALSHWHALGVDAWVRSLRDQGEERMGVVLLLPQAKDGLIIGPKDFPSCISDGRIAFISVSRILARGGPARLVQMLKMAFRLTRLWGMKPSHRWGTDRPVLRLASARDAAAALFTLAEIGTHRLLKSRDIRLVILDEGLGTYMSEALWKYARREMRPQRGRVVGARRLDLLLYGLWHRVHARIAAGYPLERRFVFTRDEATGRLRPNPPVVGSYRAAIRAAGGGGGELERSERPVALLVPGPWSEIRQVDRATELELVEGVVQRLIGEGFDVRIKPHPRETPGKYSAMARRKGERCRVEAGGRAAERFFAGMRSDDIVVGYNSTSLLAASLLYDLPTYTLNGALLCRPGVGEWLEACLKIFAELTVDSVEDFRDRFGTVDAIATASPTMSRPSRTLSSSLQTDYEAVIFDMGDVFYDATIWRKALTQHLRDIGIEIDYPRLCRRWEAKLVDVYLGRRGYWEAFREFARELGLEEVDVEDTAVFARNKAAEVADRTLFNGVAETLTDLKGRGLRLAVLTDTESPEREVRKILRALGIEACFDAVVTSRDIGCVKPEPAAYQAAADAIGVLVGRCAFVGHDPDELQGARAAGLFAIAYNHPPDVTADAYVEHFSDLKAYFPDQSPRPGETQRRVPNLRYI